MDGIFNISYKYPLDMPISKPEPPHELLAERGLQLFRDSSVSP